MRGVGGWVGGAGGACLSRGAWNTDSLLLPGQMSPTYAGYKLRTN